MRIKVSCVISCTKIRVIVGETSNIAVHLFRLFLQIDWKCFLYRKKSHMTHWKDPCVCSIRGHSASCYTLQGSKVCYRISCSTMHYALVWNKRSHWFYLTSLREVWQDCTVAWSWVCFFSLTVASFIRHTCIYT